MYKTNKMYGEGHPRNPLRQYLYPRSRVEETEVIDGRVRDKLRLPSGMFNVRAVPYNMFDEILDIPSVFDMVTIGDKNDKQPILIKSQQ